MASLKYEKIGERVGLGEGPHWDNERKVLYFVGVPDKKICKYDPATGKYTYAVIDKEGVPSVIIPVKGQKDKFLVTMKRDICVVTWDGESTKPQDINVIATLDEKLGLGINDGKVDASGRLWSGTMGDPMIDYTLYNDNVLYSFGKDRVPKIHATKITLSNGLGWSPDNKFMYYIDSYTGTVDVFDFDLEKGEIANRRHVFDLKKEGIEGGPDGLTVDADGNLWVAVFSGKQVLNVEPSSGKLLRSVPIPSPNVTSVAFGGPNLDELFVTTAQLHLTEAQLKEYPEAGYTYRITGLGVKGLPMNPFPL